METIQKFREIVTSKHGNKIVSTRLNEDYFIKNNLKTIWDDFDLITENLKETYPKISDRLIAAENSLEVQLCLTCNIKPRMITRDDTTTRKILSKYCCVKCAVKSIDKIVKQKKTLSENPKIKDDANAKRRATMLQKYGYEFNSQRPEIKPKLCLDRIPKEVKEFLTNKDWVQENYINQKKSLSQLGYELGIYYGTVREYISKLGFEVHYEYTDSVEQNIIEEYLKELGVEYIKNYAKLIPPYHVDFYLPNHKLAIEINGVHWHGEQHKTESYQLSKCDKAQEQGVKLLNFYCRDIWNKLGIIKSIIRNSIKITKNRYFARKCELKIPSRLEHIEFMRQNHIQGYHHSDVVYGLYHGDTLVAMMSFAKKDRFGNGYEWELLRYANKIDSIVIGGFSKLLRKFEEDYSPTNLISYCNKSISIGNVYEVNGFNHSHDTGASYYWYKGDLLYSRYRTNKSNLHNILDNFDKNLSESQNMINNGFKRVWDCGNKVYYKKYS